MPTRYPLHRLLFAGLAPFLAAAAPLQAQEWPNRPIRFIVPFGQGGLVDTVLTATRQMVEARLGQKIVVEYRPGAGGNVGMQAVQQSAADGYTIAVAPSNTMVINQFLFASMAFDPLRDFAPVTMLVDVPLVLSVSAKHPVQTLREFIDYARANPGKVNFGSPGSATPPHLAAELLARAAGISVVHVPYKGGNAAATALIANEVQFMLIAHASLRGQIAGGLVRPVAVAAGQRLDGLPNVPTFAEAGYPALQREMPRSWWGLVAPKGSPEAVLNRLAAEFRAALGTPEAQGRLREAGLVPVGSSPAEFAAGLPEEARNWGALIKATGLKLE
ncbi:MAG: Bug family tripartite tricarboxylate transporter substrate binding protein [Burkholderiales bacterium]